MESENRPATTRRAALIVATMASFLTPFLGSSINVALPAIGNDLGMTPVALSWVASAFILTSAVCLVPFGHLADRIGRRRVFIVGMLLFAVTTLGCGLMRSGSALIALMLGLSLLPGLTGFGLVALALAAFALFIAWERRVAHPVLDVTLLATNVVFARSNLAALINYSANFAVTFLLSLYLQYVRGLDPRQAGLVLLTQSVVMAAVSPLAGKLSDRLEPRVVASAGMGLSVAGLAWLCTLGSDTSLAAIIAALVVLGAGFGFFSSPNTNAVMSAVEKPRYGAAAATLGTMRLVGQMLSMGIAAAALTAYIGHQAVTPALHGRFLAGLHLAFAVFTVMGVAGVWASLSRGNVRAAAR